MKNILFTLSFLGIIFSLEAQLSERLQKAIDQNPEAVHAVSIQFTKQVNLDSLQRQFKLQNTPIGDRARIVNRQLMAVASRSQSEALPILNHNPDVSHFRAYYIVNRIIARAGAKALYEIAGSAKVSTIDLATGELLFEEALETTGKADMAQAGSEPGLKAINAPALWKLGYTGRGLKVFVYDSGVWPDHPAFADRYLGHFAPLKSSWHGIFFDQASGFNSNHGTHVLGTVAGLEHSNQDTIGVAFGAYWMANDHINASTAAGLPDQALLIDAFQWALNPDGDINTSNDIPAVINNSWRWRDLIDTVECGGFIVQLMNAIEAAGIANVFSGGNTGPNNNGVNSPQRINTSVVNTFTVGSIDANQSFPYPISNFSTRGPTQCPGSGSLKIHPEVVAPGQNVRSAWGRDGFNTISGTSMSSPHVSGAVLLLKEAFPGLSGDQLLQALYQSAIDMGAAGEDNTYGKGLIDVYAAFQLLSQNHIPVDPLSIPYDLELAAVSLPSTTGVTCDSLYIPQLTLLNRGDSTIHSVTVKVFKDGVLQNANPLNFNTPGLSAGGSQVLNLNPGFALSSGAQEWHFEVATSHNEYETVNNTRYIRFRKVKSEGLPFTENFETGLLDWHISNPDYALSWDTTSVIGWPNNNSAAWLNLENYSPRNNQKDALWSPVLNMPNGGPLNLAFDVAYQPYGPISSLQDTFKVWVSSNCGQSFDLVYEKDASSLNTTNQTGAGFEPQSKADWRRDTINLDAYAGEDIIVAFEGTNRNGNNLFLDNISLYQGEWDPLSREVQEFESLDIYPNPVEQWLYLKWDPIPSEVPKYFIRDSQGRTLYSSATNKQITALDISFLSAGLYLLEVVQNKQRMSLTFVKN